MQALAIKEKRGRPPVRGKRLEVILDEKLVKGLEKVKAKLGFSSRNDTIRAAIRDFLEKYNIKIEEA